MYRFLVLALTSLAATTFTGGSVPDPTSPSDYPVREAGLDRAVKYLDIAYGPDPAHRLDLYLPRVRTHSPTPIVVFVHGGGWILGDRGTVRNAGDITSLLAHGWAVASIDYRLLSLTANRWPAQIQDVKRAIRFLKGYATACVVNRGPTSSPRHALTLNRSRCTGWPRVSLDPRTVVVAGFSAGGHLALVAGTSCRVSKGRTLCPRALEPVLSRSSDLDGPLFAQNSRPTAVISQSGVVNLTAESKTSRNIGQLVRALIGCPNATNCTSAALAATEPETYLDRSDPPIYFAYSPGDTVVDPAMHATSILSSWVSILGTRRLWIDREESPRLGRWLDLLPAADCVGCPTGDGKPEFYIVTGHDTYFLNATAQRAFLERIRTRKLR